MTDKLKDQISSIVSAVSGASGSEETADLVEAITTELGDMDEGIAQTVLEDPDLRGQFMDRVQGDLVQKRENTARRDQARAESRALAARGAARQAAEAKEIAEQVEQADTSTSSRLYVPEQLKHLLFPRSKK